MKEYTNWRKNVFERDNFKCADCGFVGYITAHHIKSFISILKENNIKNIVDARSCKELWDIENGKTLCEECHKKTDNYKGRARLKKINIKIR
jgi:5-methylcytosine-specific restriction endonuclease McrA